MISTKPYLMRAIYEWCVDQGFTPYMQVAVDGRARVPREYVKDGQIVLNIGPEATHQLAIGNTDVTFQARFNGKAFPIYVPVDCVAAVYARENGQGMGFEVTPQAEAAAEVAPAEAPSAAPSVVVDTDESGGEKGDGGIHDGTSAETKPRSTSHLTRVK